MMRTSSAWAVLFGVVFLAPGCRAREPESPSPELTVGEVPRPPPLGRGAARVESDGPYNVYVAPPVQRVCTGSVPFFEFDSAHTRDVDQPTMKNLAECMLSGPLAKKSIVLIGHADPRGTTNYNERLGMDRAERVKAYLVERGVDAARLQTASHGEETASTDPKEWPRDRRVEIRLVE